MTHPFFVGSPTPRVFAHRGLATTVGKGTKSAATAVWENTALAIGAAHAAGADYVETDCRVSADGDVLLFHDTDLQRLLGDSRLLREVRTRELAELMAANGGLLTLADALDAFPTLRFNIDVKEDAVADRIGKIVASHAHRVLLTSFDDRRRQRAIEGALRAGAAMRPATSGGRKTIARLRTASLSGSRGLVTRVLSGIDAVQIPLRFGPIPIFSRSLVRAAHSVGVEVHVWTINDPAQMIAVVEAGADGVVTDRADLARSTLGVA